MLAYWVLGLPLGWVLAHPFGMGPSGIWAGFVIALGLAGIVLVWRFLRQTGPARLAAKLPGGET
jgi:multidrug resistance protein, MATE family